MLYTTLYKNKFGSYFFHPDICIPPPRSKVGLHISSQSDSYVKQKRSFYL